MVDKASTKMKAGKAAGPSGIVIEMIKAAGEKMVDSLVTLFNTIIKDGVVPKDWNMSYIVNLFKGKGDALLRGNYRGFKLQEQIMKVLEHILNVIIRDQVSIDEMQFGFMPKCGTIDAIFILRQLQEKFLSKKKNVYFAFVDLEKAFDRVPRAVLWWAMRKLGVEEWLIRVVMSMYDNAQSKVRVSNTYSNPINVSVGVHQGSVLSPLLFIIVMEALSREFRVGCPWELLYADDLVMISESLEDLKEKLRTWKQGLESKGLKVNVGKTKAMISRHDAPKSEIKSIKYPCGVCSKGTGSNSIFCTRCKKWVHHKCSGIKGRLKPDENYVCGTCANPPPVDDTPKVIEVDGDEFDIVPQFCYLGDMCGERGGCTDAVTARIRAAWKAFHHHLPILTNRGISYARRGNVFSSCVRGVLFHGSETWPMSKEDLLRLQRSDHAMIRWTCGVRLDQQHSTQSLRDKLKIDHIDDVLRWNRLRLFGHRQRQDDIEKNENY